MSLFWRQFVLSTTAFVVGALLLLLGPITVSSPFLVAEVAILAVGLVVVIGVNAILLRVGLAPLQRFARTMSSIDVQRPGFRVPVAGRGEIAELIETFNTMLGRLEAERAASSAAALSAQEAERHRIAQELHDEVGQTLTAVLLDLKRVADQAPDSVATALRQVQETTRSSVDEIRSIARRLRPGVLEELGLRSALDELTREVPRHAGLTVTSHVASDLPELADTAELVVYRIAQEGLTNTLRHANASRVDLTLRRNQAGVELCITDNGCGLRDAREGTGVRGMRERALLIGADLEVRSNPDGGTQVRLQVPATP